MHASFFWYYLFMYHVYIYIPHRLLLSLQLAAPSATERNARRRLALGYVKQFIHSFSYLFI